MTQVTASSDVWSVGCLIVELLTGYPPYYDLQPMSALFRIVQDDHPPLPDDCSALMADFLLLCFQKVWRGGGGRGARGGNARVAETCYTSKRQGIGRGLAGGVWYVPHPVMMCHPSHASLNASPPNPIQSLAPSRPSCPCQDPKLRPDPRSLLQHEWLQYNRRTLRSSWKKTTGFRSRGG